MRHPNAVAGGGHRMAELMDRFGEDQGQCIADQTFRTEMILKGMDEHIPLPDREQQAKQCADDRTDKERPRINQAQHRCHRCQEALRPHQGDAKEQIVMQQPLPGRAA